MAIVEQRCIILTCDECGETGSEEYTVHWSSREEAERYGWTQAIGRDLCPICAVKAKCLAEGHDWGAWRRGSAGTWHRSCQRTDCPDGWETSDKPPFTVAQNRGPDHA